MSSISAKTIAEGTARLRSQVDALIPGDNLVSKWVCQIEEPKEPAPRGIQEDYPRLVEQWVFGDEPGPG